MAATKIVTFFYNQPNVINLFIECYEKDCWQELIENVNQKILLLCQPSLLREKMSSIVMPILYQIRKWFHTHFERYQIQNIPDEFFWTSRGTLNWKKTAEAFVHDFTLPAMKQYLMMCLYGIEELWDDPDPFQGKEFFEKLNEILAYWTCSTMEDEGALDSIMIEGASKSDYQYAFDGAVSCGNEVAMEYFFYKLTPSEREESLSRIASLSNFQWSNLDFFPDFDFFLFLILQMNELQQSEMLETHAQEVLRSLLEWPWHQIFMEGARHMRDSLKCCDYSYLLRTMASKINDGYKDYEELFKEFWVLIPVAYKKDIVRDCDLLKDLFASIGKKNISLMLKEASPKEKEMILLDDEGLSDVYAIRICSRIAEHGDWDWLEFFIGECITSRDKMIQFKEECKEYGSFFNSLYFQFLDELVQKFSKKSGREKTDCSVPSLCSSSDMPTNQV